MINTFIVDSVGGISGSLTKLVDGTSYLVAGDNVTITSGSNGSVRVSALTGSEAVSGLYGLGGDGNVVLDGTNSVGWATRVGSVYTMTSDAYPSSLSINSSVTLGVHGYRIFVNGPCVNSGTIDNSGVGRFGGPAGTVAAGQTGNATVAGDPGNLGGAGGNGSGPTGKNGGAVDGRGPKSLPFALTMFLLDPNSPAVTATTPGAGGGGDGTSGGFGGGGGGFVIIATKSLTLLTGSIISANGGHGAAGSSGVGGGGGGGVIVLVTQTTVLNSGSLQVSGGTGGNAGVNGRIMQFIAS